MSNVGLIGATNIIFGGVAVQSPSNGSSGGGSLTPFTVVLDATGKGILEVADANLKKFGGLSFNGRPSFAYPAPYYDNESEDNDEGHAVFQVDNFDSSDAGIEITGFHWTA